MLTAETVVGEWSAAWSLQTFQSLFAEWLASPEMGCHFCCEFPISLTSFACSKHCWGNTSKYYQILSRNKFLETSLSHKKRASNFKASPNGEDTTIWFSDSLLTQQRIWAIWALTGLSGTRSWRASHICCGQLLQVHLPSLPSLPSALRFSMDGYRWAVATNGYAIDNLLHSVTYSNTIIYQDSCIYIYLYIYIFIDFDVFWLASGNIAGLRPKFIPALEMLEDLHLDESWLLIRWEHVLKLQCGMIRYYARVACDCSFHWFVLYWLYWW